MFERKRKALEGDPSTEEVTTVEGWENTEQSEPEFSGETSEGSAIERRFNWRRGSILRSTLLRNRFPFSDHSTRSSPSEESEAGVTDGAQEEGGGEEGDAVREPRRKSSLHAEHEESEEKTPTTPPLTKRASNPLEKKHKKGGDKVEDTRPLSEDRNPIESHDASRLSTQQEESPKKPSSEDGNKETMTQAEETWKLAKSLPLIDIDDVDKQGDHEELAPGPHQSPLAAAQHRSSSLIIESVPDEDEVSTYGAPTVSETLVDDGSEESVAGISEGKEEEGKHATEVEDTGKEVPSEGEETGSLDDSNDSEPEPDEIPSVTDEIEVEAGPMKTLTKAERREEGKKKKEEQKQAKKEAKEQLKEKKRQEALDKQKERKVRLEKLREDRAKREKEKELAKGQKGKKGKKKGTEVKEDKESEEGEGNSKEEKQEEAQAEPEAKDSVGPDSDSAQQGQDAQHLEVPQFEMSGRRKKGVSADPYRPVMLSQLMAEAARAHEQSTAQDASSSTSTASSNPSEEQPKKQKKKKVGGTRAATVSGKSAGSHKREKVTKGHYRSKSLGPHSTISSFSMTKGDGNTIVKEMTAGEDEKGKKKEKVVMGSRVDAELSFGKVKLQASSIWAVCPDGLSCKVKDPSHFEKFQHVDLQLHPSLIADDKAKALVIRPDASQVVKAADAAKAADALRQGIKSEKERGKMLRKERKEKERELQRMKKEEQKKMTRERKEREKQAARLKKELKKGGGSSVSMTGLANDGVKINVVVYSTGALILRHFLRLFYWSHYRHKIDHVVMFAPANYGSPWAKKVSFLPLSSPPPPLSPSPSSLLLFPPPLPSSLPLPSSSPSLHSPLFSFFLFFSPFFFNASTSCMVNIN